MLICNQFKCWNNEFIVLCSQQTEKHISYMSIEASKTFRLLGKISRQKWNIAAISRLVLHITPLFEFDTGHIFYGLVWKTYISFLSLTSTNVSSQLLSQFPWKMLRSALFHQFLSLELRDAMIFLRCRITYISPSFYI